MALALKPALGALLGVAAVAGACWWVAQDRAARERLTPPPRTQPRAPAAEPADRVPRLPASLELRVMPADWSCPEQQYGVTDFDPLDPENHVTVGDISLRVQSDGDACGPALVTARVACAGQGETFAFEIPRGATDGAVLAVRLLHATDPPAGDLGSAFRATRLAQFEGALSLRDGWLVPGLRVPVRLALHYTLVRDARPVVPTGEPDAPAPSRRTRARFSGVVEVVAPER